MIPVLVLIVICALVWGFVKQAARTFDKPEWWDMADPAAGGVAFLGFAYVHHPFIGQYNDPVMMLIYNSGVFAIGVVIMTMMLGLGAEDEGLLRTPDDLAPIEYRLFERISSTDEITDGMRNRWEK